MATKSTAVKSKKSSATKLRSISLPPIGKRWPGQGGIFAGLMPGKGGKFLAVILGKALPEGNFSESQERAAATVIDGHKDFRCPTRDEQRLLFINLKNKFKPQWYWSNERRADTDDYAWVQDFESGYQDNDGVDYECLACAVRVIQL
mgnify:FL=1